MSDEPLDPTADPEAQDSNESPATPGAPAATSPAAEGESDPAASGDLEAELEELRAELAAERTEKARLASELGARYGQPAPPAAGADAGAADEAALEREFDELATDLGVDSKRFRRLIDNRASQIAQRAAAAAELRVRATQLAERKTEDFYTRFPKLAKHRPYVDSVVRSFLADPARHRNRRLFESDEMLVEIAKEAHTGLRLPFEERQPARFQSPGHVESAHVQPGRAKPPARAPSREEPVDDVTDWMQGLAQQRERGIQGASVQGRNRPS